MKIKTILVEDERLARNELKNLLERHPQIEIIDEAENVSQGLQKIEELRPDLIFLDINMPGNKSGFDLLEMLDYIPKVVFTTAHDEFAIKAFEVNALDYLLKPIDTQRLDEAIEKSRKIATIFPCFYSATKKIKCGGQGICKRRRTLLVCKNWGCSIFRNRRKLQQGFL